MDLELALNDLDRQLRNREPGRTFVVREGEARPREIAAYQRRNPQKRVIVRVIVTPKRGPGVPRPAPAPASPLPAALGSTAGSGGSRDRPGTGGEPGRARSGVRFSK